MDDDDDKFVEYLIQDCSQEGEARMTRWRSLDSSAGARFARCAVGTLAPLASNERLQTPVIDNQKVVIFDRA